ncbi:hypothetical protein D9611_009789 [Ephemerocybe angulata]|uniref:Phosphoribulokinase/uridine kinase domain-containing protein n=1 Tax=Ephemerocybe angulata TaxID=980116 RepID=A0A8H5FJR9_9AGAR|nr:hypothetical protein D9611_009789 [Tulosesus angulatus]
MNSEMNKLAAYLVRKLESTSENERFLVGISGSPASGKSTVAQHLVDEVNKALKANSSDSQAILVGLDGWHLTRAQLDAFPDPQLAHSRRGAHWTFDGPGYVEWIHSLRTQGEVKLAPSFDHAVKDPTPNAVSVHPYHRIVVIEGLYTFLSIEPWSAGSALLDERWWIEVDEEEAQRRLIKRHVISGVAKDEEEALWRAEENDLPNARFIRENMLEPTRVLHSNQDEALA